MTMTDADAVIVPEVLGLTADKLRKLAANAADAAATLDQWAAGDTGLPDTPEHRADCLREARQIVAELRNAAAYTGAGLSVALTIGAQIDGAPWQLVYAHTRSVMADEVTEWAADVRDETADDMRDM